MSQSQADEQADEKKELESPKGATPFPTVYVDSFFLTYWADRMKISFSEIIDGTEYFRASFMLPMSDAVILANRILEANKETVDQAKSEMDDKAKSA
jgi:hypothetical protein